ncbi:Snf7 family [Myxozyma melibiosi]|uniref:Snf7 family n=1 Tax=Myxozyma melibiosi TaxID=54550 RepID=A0ABR1FBN9_9ASCO
MSGLEKSLFNLKFTAKSLNKQANKAAKDELREKEKVKKAIQQGNNDIAKLYAQNAIRKQSERMNLLRLASRIDAVASRVQTAVTMRNVTGNMANVVKNMDRAMESMNLEKMSMVMEKFEQQFEDLDVTTSYYEEAGQVNNAVAAPQEDVDLLMQKVADEAGLEMQQTLEVNTPAKGKVGPSPTEVEEDSLGERLRALRA